MVNIKNDNKQDQAQRFDPANIGAMIIRIGFWGPLYYHCNKEPPTVLVIIPAPIATSACGDSHLELLPCSLFSRRRNRQLRGLAFAIEPLGFGGFRV